ncbi:MAG: hypothetical protein H6732_08070 [Alphaproteobacteria bacterium]|nr:hypothetical protein [Alphaproteobacteria bacterium]
MSTHLDLVTRQLRHRLHREGVGLVITSLVVGGLGGAPVLTMLAPDLRDEPVFEVALPRERVAAFIVLASELPEEPEEPEADEPEAPAVAEAPPPRRRARRPEPAPAPEPVPELAEEVAAVEIPATTPEPEPAATEAPADDAVAEADGDAEGEDEGSDEDEDEGEEDAAQDEPVAATSAPPRPRRNRCGPDNPAIRPLGPDRFEVERELVLYHTASLARIQALAGGGPFRDKDKGVKGWQIRNFGCNNPLFKGGLRNRDVIQAVNGRKTNTVVQILGIWLGQRHRSDFEVQVLRKGRPLTLHYRLI